MTQYREVISLEELKKERFGVPSAGEYLCPYCHKVVDQKQPHFRKASGWEKVRGRNEGVRPLVMREILGEVAHSWCVDAARVVGNQGTLL